MRQWIAIICLIGLLAYIGMVMDHQQRSGVSEPALSGLTRAMSSVGGQLDAVSFMLTAPISDPALPFRLREALTNATQPVRLADQPRVDLITRDDLYYLELRWRLTGEMLTQWPTWYEALSAALLSEGIAEQAHIQLEGLTGKADSDLLGLVNSALDSLKATARQPWTEGRSASVAARTSALPTGPHDVNVQVAARQMDQGVRLFVTWPAMTGDY